MRKILLFSVIVGLVFCLPSTAAVAKNHRIKLHSDAIVSGQTIESGSYMVKIDDEGVLSIWKRGDMLAEAEVVVEPLGNGTPNSVSMDRDGNLRELRFKDEKVVFPMLSNAGQTSE